MNVRDWARLNLAVPLSGLVVTAAIALALFPITRSDAFWPIGLTGAAVVVLVGVACRASGHSRPYAVPAQLVALLLWASLVVAPRDAWYGLLPTRDTAKTFGGDIERVLVLANDYLAPLPTSPALTAVLAVSVALLGFLVDLVAVTARRAAVVGLLLLGVYMVPVAALSGQVSMHAFWPGALAWTGLLLASERSTLRRWDLDAAARKHEDPSGSVPVDDVLPARGRQVAFSAVGVALVLPLLLPAASLRLVGSGGTIGIGDGPGDDVIAVDNPVLDLRRNLVDQPQLELVRVRTDDPAPGYLRTTALDEFTGTQWEPSGREEEDGVSADSDTLPAPPGMSGSTPTREVHYDVQLSPAFASAWLPVAYAPTSLDVDGDWRVDENTLDVVIGDQDQLATSFAYSFTASVPDPTPEQLRTAPAPPDSLDPLTDLPSSLPPQIASQARAVTQGIDNRYEQALALEQWFRTDGDFVYTTEPSAGTGEDTIAAFVTDDRRGYCEQFASAMALMARALDIPARVAVGFLRPESEGGDTWSYQGGALHTWPELYFAGAGWVRFEPTPADRTGAAAVPNDTAAPERDNSFERQAVDPEANQKPVDVGSGTPIRVLAEEPLPISTRLDNRVSAALATLLLLALVPAAWREGRRRRRWNHAHAHPDAAAEVAWDELGDGVADLRHPWRGALTPRATGRALRAAALDRDAVAIEALNRLVRAVERSRYAAADVAGVSPASLRADVDTVLTAVSDGCSPTRQRLARWLPRSVLPTAVGEIIQSRGRTGWQRLRPRHATGLAS